MGSSAVFILPTVPGHWDPDWYMIVRKLMHFSCWRICCYRTICNCFRIHTDVYLRKFSWEQIGKQLFWFWQAVNKCHPLSSLNNTVTFLLQYHPLDHAVLMANKHFRTFDGRIYDLASKCSVLLAKDFVHNTFTIVLNQESSGLRSLHVEMNRTTIDIYPGLKVGGESQTSFLSRRECATLKSLHFDSKANPEFICTPDIA